MDSERFNEHDIVVFSNVFIVDQLYHQFHNYHNWHKTVVNMHLEYFFRSYYNNFSFNSKYRTSDYTFSEHFIAPLHAHFSNFYHRFDKLWFSYVTTGVYQLEVNNVINT